mgnify:CR=1 FL=1
MPRNSTNNGCLMKHTYSIIAAALLMSVSASSQAYDVELSKHIETITLPEPIKRIPPRYPIQAARESREGWAKFSFIIEKDGSVSNIVVGETSGSRDMTREGIRALKQWKYEPAMIDGKPVQQCNNTVQLDFRMSDNSRRSVSKRFRSRYKKAMKAIQNNKFEEANTHLAAIKQFKNTNITEHNYYQLASLLLSEKLGNKQQQLHHIYQISHRGDYLNNELKLTLLQKKFALEVDSNKLFNAFNTYNQLAKHPLADTYLPKYQKVLDKIKHHIDQGDTISIQGNILDSEYWSHTLIGNQFSISDIEGNLTTLDVRCKTKHHKYTFEANNTWTLPESWKNCRVLVYGEDNAKFTLLEQLAKT